MLWATTAADNDGAAGNTGGGNGDAATGGVTVCGASAGATALPLILIFVGCDTAIACEFLCSCLW